MKKLLLAAIIGLTLISCSKDDEVTTQPQNSKLELAVKHCVEIELQNQQHKDITPPGLTLCDCVNQAIQENTKKQ